MTGVGGATGVGIVEVFELDTMSRLENISTRGFVGVDINQMIGGFVITGDTPKVVVVRGRGPSLADFDLDPVLEDPQIRLTRVTGEEIDTNDNQASHPWASLVPSRLNTSEPNDSIIMTSLEPGHYTAILSGVGGGTGIGIVEVFEVRDDEIDIDGDEQTNDVDTDDDNDGISDEDDLHPNDMSRAGDGDGVDSLQDDDDDGDGVIDAEDLDPFDPGVGSASNVCVFDQSNWDESNFE